MNNQSLPPPPYIGVEQLKVHANKTYKKVEIELHNGSSFDIGDCIHGNLFIRPVSQNINFKQLTIELILVESVTGESGVSHVEETRLSKKTLLDDSSYPIYGSLQIGMEYTVPFELPISASSPKTSPQLPPSLGALYNDAYDKRHDINSMTARINYIIRLRIDNIIQSAIKSIKVIPSSHHYTPPTAKTYGTTAKEHYDNASNDPPFFFKIKDFAGTLSLSNVSPMLLKFELACSNPLPVRIKYKLNSNTSIADGDPDINATTTTSTTVETIIQKRIEINNGLRCEWEEHAHGLYIGTGEIPIIIPAEGHPQLVPTFSTKLTKREYQMEVTVEFDERSRPLLFWKRQQQQKNNSLSLPLIVTR